MEKYECFPFIYDLYKGTFLCMRIDYLLFWVLCFFARYLFSSCNHVPDYIPLHVRGSHALFIMQYVAIGNRVIVQEIVWLCEKSCDCACASCLWDLCRVDKPCLPCILQCLPCILAVHTFPVAWVRYICKFHSTSFSNVMTDSVTVSDMEQAHFLWGQSSQMTSAPKTILVTI